MRTFVLIDTTIFLNILNLAGHNQHRDLVLAEFDVLIEEEAWIRLPLATIWETGNHVSNIRNGTERYKAALGFKETVSQALDGKKPYKATEFPNQEVLTRWLAVFPAYAKGGNAEKDKEGLSFANVSLIQEWEHLCAQFPRDRVRIWSLANDLMAYDRHP